MELTVKGKHLDVGDSLREHVREQLTHTAQKYFREPIEATVIFSKEKNHLFSANISIHVGGGILLQTHHEANDPYPAFDVAAKLVGKRLSRYKDKLRDHHKYEAPDELTATYTTLHSDKEASDSEAGSAVIAEMETQIQTLAVADAVMRLELGGFPAMLFRNPKHGGLNMVYRRKDGNVGWVDPPAAKIPAPAAVKPLPKKPVAKIAPKKPAVVKVSAKKKAVVKKKKK